MYVSHPRCSIIFFKPRLKICGGCTCPPCPSPSTRLYCVPLCSRSYRKDGLNKLVRIYHEKGMYGFSKPCTYDSVAALILFYTAHSMSEYNHSMDVRLEKPVFKPSVRYIVQLATYGHQHEHTCMRAKTQEFFSYNNACEVFWAWLLNEILHAFLPVRPNKANPGKCLKSTQGGRCSICTHGNRYFPWKYHPGA